VTLKKCPTLGIGITGGKDGENALRPGDKGFYVFKLVENMPAAKSGKVAIGDKILEVNGIETGNLTNDQLVKLLTSHETYVTILFCREPSVTLL
jgi:protein scribble